MPQDLPIISNDRDWIGLNVEDHALVVGTVDSSSRSALLVRFADWSQIVIEIIDGNRFIYPAGEAIRLEVERTEDGLMTTSDDITTAIVEYGTI